MQTFKVGDGVSGMYFSPTSGTVLDPSGEVTAVSTLSDGRTHVWVRFPNHPTHVVYIVSKSGMCDYMHKTVDFTPHPTTTDD